MVNVYAEKTVNVAEFHIEVNVLKGGRDFIVFWFGLISYLNLLNCEFVVSRAILAKLSCQNG